jgi:putative DNA primase/helicase
MIDGCTDWQGKGLEQPEAVRKATIDYLAAEDTVAEWLAECCTTRPNDTASSSALFKSWSKWATAAGEFTGSQKRFSQLLEGRGFVKSHERTGAQFQGIALIPVPDLVPSWGTDR